MKLLSRWAGRTRAASWDGDDMAASIAPASISRAAGGQANVVG
jgi:hypothetical protein